MGHFQLSSDGDLDAPAGRDKVRALLVDDDAVDCSVIKRLIEDSRHLDFELTICRSLEAARALGPQRFDIVYVDYWLGVETSISFIHDYVRAHDVPCVLLTSLDEPDIRRVAFRAGVEGYLSKDDLSRQALEGVTLAVLRHHAML
jgi:DNA-binding NarL/FixJ family response regulator